MKLDEMFKKPINSKVNSKPTSEEEVVKTEITQEPVNRVVNNSADKEIFWGVTEGTEEGWVKRLKQNHPWAYESLLRWD